MALYESLTTLQKNQMISRNLIQNKLNLVYAPVEISGGASGGLCRISV